MLCSRSSEWPLTSSNESLHPGVQGDGILAPVLKEHPQGVFKKLLTVPKDSLHVNVTFDLQH